MTIGVDYGYGFFISHTSAVEGDEIDYSFALSASDGSAIPANTRVRLSINSTGGLGIFARSVLRTLEFGAVQETLGRIRLSRGAQNRGGTLTVSFRAALIGDEDGQARTISGASRTIRILPRGSRRDAPGADDGPPTAIAATPTIWDGQQFGFWVTGSGRKEVSIGANPIGISSTPEMSNYALWTGRQDYPYGGNRDGDLYTFGNPTGYFRSTGVNANITGTTTVRLVTWNSLGRDEASLRVLPRIGSSVGSGTTSSGGNGEGWQQYTRDDNPTFPRDPDDARPTDYINLDGSDDPTTTDKRTVVLSGDNSEVMGVTIDNNVCIDDQSVEAIPEEAMVNIGDDSEFITNTDDSEDIQNQPQLHGSGGLRKRGTGTARVNPASSFEGFTNVEAGKLIVPPGSLDQTSGINLSADACITFEPQTTSANINLSDGNNIIETSGGTTNYFGSITGSALSRLTIRSQDGGTFRIRRHNENFQGTLVVEQGAVLSLEADNENDIIHTGDIEVFGTLKVRGVINGNVTFRDGGYCLVGAEPGTNTQINGNLTFEGNCHTFISILENDNDMLIVNGNITIGNNVELLLHAFENNTMSNPYTFVRYTGTLTGTYDRVTNSRDDDPRNGITLDDSEYPDTLDYSTNGIITGTK